MALTEQDLSAQFNQFLLQATRQFDSAIERYLEGVQNKQFQINQIVTLEDIGTSGTIVFTNKVGQSVLITSALITVPTGTTSLTITIGRYSIIIDSPAVITNLNHLKYVVGKADTLKVSYTPNGTHAAYAAFFGEITGDNMQL